MKKLKLILYGLLILLASGVFFYAKGYYGERGKRKIAESNVVAAMAEIKTYQSKNNELVSEIQGLRLNASDLEKVNKRLSDEVADMKIKLKNATSVSQIETNFHYTNTDSIVSEVIPAPDLPDVIDRKFSINNESIDMSFVVRDCSVILPESINLSINNRQTIVTDVTYKGWWFWKRATGVNLKVKNSNRYYTVNNIYYIDLRDY